MGACATDKNAHNKCDEMKWYRTVFIVEGAEWRSWEDYEDKSPAP